MQHCSLLADLTYGESQPLITPILVNDFSKEIRIVFRMGQSMKSHKTAFPITVMVVRGSIDFGVGVEQISVGEGDVIALEPNIMHDLVALEDSIVRLSLHKSDSIARVNGVLKL